MLTDLDKQKIGPIIGRGQFSTVHEYGHNHVAIFTTDPVKEAIALGWCGSSTFLPKLRRVWVNNDDNKQVYLSKRYPKVTAPRRQLNERAYAQYQLLRKLCAGSPPKTGYSTIVTAFQSLPKCAMRRALLEATDGICCYGENFSFEISPRNIAATPAGNLILLDVFFFRPSKRVMN